MQAPGPKVSQQRFFARVFIESDLDNLHQSWNGGFSALSGESTGASDVW